MSEHFNNLSPEVAELLAILGEECGEVSQRVGKILRHGLRTNPYDPGGATNAEKLEDELADIRAICGLLAQLGVLDLNRIGALQRPKLDKLRRPDILHHSTLLKPNPCLYCGSTAFIQKPVYQGREDLVKCADSHECDMRSDERERRRVSHATLSGDAW